MSASISSLEDSIVSAADLFGSTFWIIGLMLLIFGMIKFYQSAISGDSMSGGITAIIAAISIIVMSSILNEEFFSENDSKYYVQNKNKDYVEVGQSKSDKNFSTKNTPIVKIPTEEELARLKREEAIKAEVAIKTAKIKEAAAKAEYERRVELFQKGFIIFLSIIFFIGISITSYLYLRYKFIYIKTNKLVNIDNSFENIVENIEFIDSQILKNNEFFNKNSMFCNRLKSINEKLKIKRVKFEEIIKDFEQKIPTET